MENGPLAENGFELLLEKLWTVPVADVVNVSSKMPGVFPEVSAPCVLVGSAHHLTVIVEPIVACQVPEAVSSAFTTGPAKLMSLVVTVTVFSTPVSLITANEELLRLSMPGAPGTPVAVDEFAIFQIRH